MKTLGRVCDGNVGLPSDFRESGIMATIVFDDTGVFYIELLGLNRN